MKRIPVAALAASLLVTGLPVAAQSTAVIYGRLYPEWTHARTHGATAAGSEVATMQARPSGARASIAALEASNSRIGVRGEERLGGGLRVVWQIEQQVDVSQGGGALASRDTFLGFASDTYGTLRVGNFDTVYKNFGDTLGFLGIGSGNFVSLSNVLSKSNLSDTSAASFHLRRANSVDWESPEWDGVRVALQYSPDESRNASRDAWLWSGGIAFERGALYVAAAYELHADLFGGSRASAAPLRNVDDRAARSRDDAWRLTARYRFGAHAVEANYARLRYRERGGAPGRFGRFESDRIGLTWDARWTGPWRTAVAWAIADDGSCRLLGNVACSTAGLGGAMLAAGAGYNLSRRTMLFALASHLRNGRSARFNNADSLDAAVGADITQFALGMSHTF